MPAHLLQKFHQYFLVSPCLHTHDNVGGTTETEMEVSWIKSDSRVISCRILERLKAFIDSAILPEPWASQHVSSQLVPDHNKYVMVISRCMMCTQTMTQTKMRCGHRIDGEGTKMVCPERCGRYTTNWSFGVTTRRCPCDDCQVNGLWVKDDKGKWTKA